MSGLTEDRVIANTLALRAVVARLVSNVAIYCGPLAGGERAWLARELQAVTDSIERSAFAGLDAERQSAIIAEASAIASRLFISSQAPDGG